jgi:hypothetical protein
LTQAHSRHVVASWPSAFAVVLATVRWPRAHAQAVWPRDRNAQADDVVDAGAIAGTAVFIAERGP